MPGGFGPLFAMSSIAKI